MNTLNYTLLTVIISFCFVLFSSAQNHTLEYFEQKKCLNGNTPAISFQISGFDKNTNYVIYYGNVRLNTYKTNGFGLIHTSNENANNAGCDQLLDFVIYAQNGGPDKPASYITTVSAAAHQGPSLPIELSYFGATATDRQIQLIWKTESEQHNDYMEVQRSKDGKTFETIAVVNGQGNSAIPQSYRTVDANPLPGVNYYRLMQVDFDGKTEYHQIIAVLFKAQHRNTQAITVFPTVATDQINITLSEETTTESELIILDLNGNMRLRQPFAQGIQQTSVGIDQLPQGHYILTLQNGRNTQTARFIKG